MDRRVGKRALGRLEEDMRQAPNIVRYFYVLRCKAEGLPVNVDVPETLIVDWRAPRT